MAIDSNLIQELGEIGAGEAIELLCNEFHLDRAFISFVRTKRRSEIKTFLGVPGLNGVLAREFGPLQFWGGPPKARGFHTGTLLTYLCDAILYNWMVYGNYADLVQGMEDESQLYAVK